MKGDAGVGAVDTIAAVLASKGSAESTGPIKPKDFWWDMFIKYLAATIALGTALETALQFLGNDGPSCTVSGRDNASAYEISHDDIVYINRFCQQSFTRAIYYPLFLFSQSIALTAPDFLWGAINVGCFDYFFRVVTDLDRFRSGETGTYEEKNFKILKKLENKFGLKAEIFHFYIFKLCLQILVILTAIAINILIFRDEHFNLYFVCPVGCDISVEGWQFMFCVTCVFPPFRLYRLLFIIDLTLLSVALLILGWGIFWCFKKHVEILGSDVTAKFAFKSCLLPTQYDISSSKKSHWFKVLFCCFNCSESVCQNIFCLTSEYRIKNDLDFLLLRLYSADLGYGADFRAIQVEREFKRESKKNIISSDKGKQSRHNTAVEISFGSNIYFPSLASKYDRVLSINIDPFFKSPKPNYEEFLGYSTLQVHARMFTKGTEDLDKFAEIITKDIQKKVSYILVGPITDESDITAVQKCLIVMNAKLDLDCRLDAIQPVKIGTQEVTSCTFTSTDLELFDESKTDDFSKFKEVLKKREMTTEKREKGKFRFEEEYEGVICELVISGFEYKNKNIRGAMSSVVEELDTFIKTGLSVKTALVIPKRYSDILEKRFTRTLNEDEFHAEQKCQVHFIVVNFCAIRNKDSVSAETVLKDIAENISLARSCILMCVSQERESVVAPPENSFVMDKRITLYMKQRNVGELQEDHLIVYVPFYGSLQGKRYKITFYRYDNPDIREDLSQLSDAPDMAELAKDLYTKYEKEMKELQDHELTTMKLNPYLKGEVKERLQSYRVIKASSSDGNWSVDLYKGISLCLVGSEYLATSLELFLLLYISRHHYEEHSLDSKSQLNPHYPHVMSFLAGVLQRPILLLFQETTQLYRPCCTHDIVGQPVVIMGQNHGESGFNFSFLVPESNTELLDVFLHLVRHQGQETIQYELHNLKSITMNDTFFQREYEAVRKLKPATIDKKSALEQRILSPSNLDEEVKIPEYCKIEVSASGASGCYLYESVSLCLDGTEELADTLRLLTALYAEKHCHTELCFGDKIDPNLLDPQFLTNNDNLTIKEKLEKEAVEIARNTVNSGFLQIRLLAGVLQRPIIFLYPDTPPLFVPCCIDDLFPEPIVIIGAKYDDCDSTKIRFSPLIPKSSKDISEAYLFILLKEGFHSLALKIYDVYFTKISNHIQRIKPFSGLLSPERQVQLSSGRILTGCSIFKYDGLYNNISICLSGTEDLASTLKLLSILQMVKQYDRSIQELKPDDPSNVDRHLLLAFNRAHGIADKDKGYEFELQFSAEVLKRPILLIILKGRVGLNCIKFVPGTEEEEQEPIAIVKYDDRFYSLIPQTSEIGSIEEHIPETKIKVFSMEQAKRFRPVEERHFSQLWDVNHDLRNLRLCHHEKYFTRLARVYFSKYRDNMLMQRVALLDTITKQNFPGIKTSQQVRHMHSSLEDRIYKKFFVKHSSTDNGSSLFHSVSICLVSTEDLSTTLRLLTTLYAVEHFKDYHEKLLSSFSTIAYEYFGLRDITSSGVPDGDNLSISLKYEALKTATDANASGLMQIHYLACVLNRRIILISRTRMMEVYKPCDRHEHLTEPPLVIMALHLDPFNRDKNHFVALIPKSSDDISSLEQLLPKGTMDGRDDIPNLNLLTIESTRSREDISIPLPQATTQLIDQPVERVLRLLRIETAL